MGKMVHEHAVGDWLLRHPRTIAPFLFGVLAYLLLVSTALVNELQARVKRMPRIPLVFHPRLAYVTVGLATLHGLLALSVYL